MHIESGADMDGIEGQQSLGEIFFISYLSKTMRVSLSCGMLVAYNYVIDVSSHLGLLGPNNLARYFLACAWC